MAINYELLNKGGISLGTNFELLSEKPLDSRLVVPSLAGLQNYIDNAAAYEGMIVYDNDTKKTYQVQTIDGVLSYREFGINEEELRALISAETTAAMEFKGVAAALPENPAKGDMYKVSGENISIKIDDVDAKIGDTIVYNGEQWFLIPSGDDIEDTWRPVTDVDNDATLTFVAGDKLEKTVASNGTITYKHEAIDAPVDVTKEGDEKTRTYITAVETDGFGHITGYKTATENVEDTDTTYAFEGQSEDATSVYFQVTSSEEGASAEIVYLDAYSKNETNAELAKKLDKSVYDAYIDGKAMSDEELKQYAKDYADGLAGNYDENGAAAGVKSELEAEIAKKVDAVDGKDLIATSEIERLSKVDNYDDEEVRGLIGDNAKAIDDLESYVGTIPTDYTETNVISYINKKAEETLAAAQGSSSETVASVKQQLDDYKSENDTRVKAAEDAIDAIEADYLTSSDKTELSGTIADVKKTADAAATKEYADAELAKKVDKTDYEADKATFATKTEVGNVDAKFANYVTSASYADDKAAIDKAIEDEIKARGDADAETLKSANAYADSLADNYDAAGVAEAKVKELAEGAVADNAEAIAAINDETNGILKKSKDYTDGEIDKLEEIVNGKADGVHTHTDAQVTCTDYEGKTLVNVIRNELAKKAHTHVAADITDFSTEVNKVITDAGVATDEALAAMGGRVTQLETDSATHATKTELNKVDNKFGIIINTVTGGLNMTTNTNATNKALDERVSAVEADLGIASSDGVDATGLHADVESLDARLTTLNGALNGVDGTNKRLVAVAGKVTTLEGEMDTAQADIEELKNTVTGLEGAMHFVGVSSTDPLGESGATVEGEEGFVAGDVVLYDGKEYIYDLNDNWILFGDEGSYLTKTEAASTYLAKSDASATYLAKEDAASIYHTIEEAHSEHEAITGLINGKVDSSTYATDKAALEKADSDNLQAAKDYTDEKIGDVDLSGIATNASAIEALEGDVKGLKEAPSAGIQATDIAAWNGEIGAKALAETKTTTEEVKAQIEEYGYATTGYVDGKADAAKDAAIADAAAKYETIGTAQGIVDGLKLAETYEPIGAEARATAAAKTETENQVKALADNTYTKEQTFTKDEVNAAIAAAVEAAYTWGSF